MYREETTQYSSYLNRDMHMLIHGHAGVPFLSFPTQDSMCRFYWIINISNTGQGGNRIYV